MNLLDLARSAVPAVPADEQAARRWKVRYPGTGPMEVLVAPPASRAEVAGVYPGAEIDVLPEPSRRTATPSEAAELRELIALVLTDAGNAGWEEALTAALADPEAALVSFRLLAADAMERMRYKAKLGST